MQYLQLLEQLHPHPVEMADYDQALDFKLLLPENMAEFIEGGVGSGRGGSDGSV